MGMGMMNFAFLRPEPLPPNNRKVAIIGAGPSGLTVTGYLASLGYQVEVYDKLPKAGGLMLFGIPAHRIPAERIEEGVRHLERNLGVNFHLRTKICCSVPLHQEEGDHFSFDMISLTELVDTHDAVMICTGSWQSRRLNIPGETLPGVYAGLQFLFPIRAAHYGTPNVTVPDVMGKTVVVIGAGHSAVDVAHSALHLGAGKVVMVYRRTRNEATCGLFEIERLIELGVDWRELVTPVKVLGAERVEGLEVTQCELGEPDETGRRKAVPTSCRLETIEAQMVVTAIGETPSPPFAGELGLENIRKGEVRWLNMTSIENVFVAGDVLSGPSKIGKAIYSGLRAARSLSNWLDLKAQNRQREYKSDDFVGKEKSE
jgi:glutamate synthase (NADPH/NADH) small chain